MKLSNINCARHVRDGGIDAIAALNDSLRDAVSELDEESQRDLKLAFGEVMGEITARIINPAVRAFPELDPNQETWDAVVRARAQARASAT